MSVRGNFPTKSVRVGNNGLHLFKRVLRGIWIVAFREHPSGGAHFDQVRSILDYFSRLVLHLLDAISGAVRSRVVLVWKQVVVAVTSGNAQGGSAHQHARSGYIAGINRISQRHIAVSASANIADGCKTRLQRESRVVCANQRFAWYGDRKRVIPELRIEG